MISGLIRLRGTIAVLFIAWLLVCLPPLAASTERTNATRSNIQRTSGHKGFAFRTFPVSPARNSVALDSSSCPNQGGILDSISVPVAMPLELAVVSFEPAPPGGATFMLSSEDPTIVAAGDPHQSFLPEVTIPEGETQSNPFFVYGIKVGATMLDAISESPCCIGFSDPLGAWDINPGSDPSTSKFLDANPPSNTCRTPDTPDLSTDPGVLSTCGTPVQGAVTDGVTQLLLRMVSGLPGTACYQITSDGPPDQGMISTDVTDTQSVDDFNDAFSFYTAPDGYGDTSDSRQVQVQFTFTPNIGNGDTTMFTVPLTLIRPPVMLIHGVWSDRKAWSGSYWNRTPGSSYFTFKGDYGPTHDASFSTNEPMVQGFVSSAIQMAQAGGYAATQADVVAHSMGGILTRLYVASDDFMRDDNYQKGDVHRLITLDTPHGGASFANLLVALHTTKPTQIEASVHNLVGATAQVVNGAVCDLNENSQGIQALTSTSIDSQVFTATGGPVGSFWNGVGPFHLHSFENELTKTQCLKRNIFFVCTQQQPVYDQTVVKDFRFTATNDAIVPLCSQQGGVEGSSCPGGGSAGVNFGNLIHFGADVFGFSVVDGINNTAAVATQAFQLLDGSSDDLASSIPGVPSNGSGVPITVSGQGAHIDQANFNSQCVTGAPPPMKADVVLSGSASEIATASDVTSHPAVADARVNITTPTNGQQFAPGDTVSVTVAITAPLLANDVSLNIAGLGSEPGTNYNGSTYQVTFSIPDTYAGPIELSPAITDASNNPITGITTTIAVRPTTPPSSLTLPQANYILNTVGATERIAVVGNYPGSIQRDLTSSASGTTYNSSNIKVIIVDTEGNVSAAGFGTAAVRVTNSGVQTFATFTVEDPAHPLAAQDVTSSALLTRLGFRVDRNTGFFDQTVELSTAFATPIIGPLYLVVSGLPTGITLVNSGVTQNIPPIGSPYFKLPLPDGATLPSGTILNKTLQFLNPGRTRIAYTAKVFRISGTP